VFLHFTRYELRTVLIKVYQALKPGGRVVFSLKAGDGDELTERKLDSKRYFCYWQPEVIEHLLSVLEFTQVRTIIIDDYRGKIQPDWLLISALK
jgi:hypothetical protein